MVVAFWRVLADIGLTTVPEFRDPFARRMLRGPIWKFLIARAERIARKPDNELRRSILPFIDMVILRVAYIDACVERLRAPQVVILGAGLDTRAYRLTALRGVRVFETDHRASQAYKRERASRLGPSLAEVHYAPIDFTRHELGSALSFAGYDPRLPTLWIWEGVTMYLNDAALRKTLRGVRQLSAPGSTLLVHYHEAQKFDGTTLGRKLILAWAREPQIGLRSRDTMRAELERAGFVVTGDAGLVEQARHIGAHPPPAAKLPSSRIMTAHVPAVQI